MSKHRRSRPFSIDIKITWNNENARQIDADSLCVVVVTY